jgi:predicted GTPase
MKRTIIMGAGGRDFHNFNVVYRADPSTEVVAEDDVEVVEVAAACAHHEHPALRLRAHAATARPSQSPVTSA